MGGKSQPDFGDVAASQGEENAGVVRDQLYANRPDQYTPWGYSSWQQDESVDAQGNPITNWTQTTGLTPELQDIYNKQVAIQGGRSDVAGMLTGRMGAEYGQAMDWRGLNPMGQVPTSQFTIPEGDVGDPYQTRQRAEDAMYNQAQSRIAPMQDSQRAALETKMRNQGLSPGDQAWQSQMQSQGNQFNDQNNQAMWSSVGEGRNESGQMFGQQMGRNQNAFNQALGANAQNYGQAMQGSQYANQIRQQQITEALTKRGSSLNEINALLSGQQVGMPSMPNFQGAQAAAPAPYMQGAAQDASAANAANPMNGLMGLAGSLGGAAITASDRRLKYNIKRIGTNKGYPWYSYNLKFDGSAHEGVMADEIPQEHVIDIGGLKAVNYGTLLGE
jgi:hypothetical protein